MPVLAVVSSVLVPACSSDSASPGAPTALPSIADSTSPTSRGPDPTLALRPRREIAQLVPAPEGERTSAVQVSVAELAAGDLTGDGAADLVITYLRWSSAERYPLTVLVSDGIGGMYDATTKLFDGRIPRTQHPRQTVLADFNGDRRLDIFVADTGVDVEPFAGHPNTLALSTTDGRYVDATATLPQRPAYTHAAAAGDVDGDRDLDLFVAESPPRILINDGRGRFADGGSRLPPSFGASGVLTRAELADVDGDRAVDLVVVGDGFERAVLVNDGDGRFTQVRGALPPVVFGDDAIGTAVEPADLDGNADLDLLLAWTKRTPFYEGRWVQGLVGNGDGTFRDETVARLPLAMNDAQWIYDLVVGDLDDDGLADLGMDLGPTFADPGRSPSPPFLLGLPGGTFVPVPPDGSHDQPYGQFRFVDLDGDDRIEVVSAWADPSRGVTVAVSTIES